MALHLAIKAKVNADKGLQRATAGFEGESDKDGLGAPALVSGNLLRSFDGWLLEDGDPSFTASFSIACASKGWLSLTPMM